MTRVKYLIIILLCILPLCASAQTEANISQYYAAPTLINPAATGQTDFVRIRGGARLQWLGIENAPKTFMGAADMPFKVGNSRVGVGAVVAQESIGLYSSMDLGVQASYKLKKWGGVWSIGLQIGFRDQSFKGSEVYLPDGDDYHQGTDDAIPTSDIHGTAFDGALGLWYEHPKFYAGLSCTHLMSPTITMNAESSSGGSETSSDRKYVFQARRTLYFTSGCNIPIKNTLFEVIPSLMVRSDFTTTDFQLTGRVRYNKLFTAGLGYRYNDALSIMLGAEIKGIFIGYSYDYHLSDIAKASSGSHELVAGYNLKLDFSEKNRHKHKSIRIM